MNTVFESSTALLPRVNVSMRRTKRILQFNDTLIELVTDAGEILAKLHD